MRLNGAYFLSMVLENSVTQSPHIVDIRIYIFTRIRSAAKTKLNYVADIVLDRKDTPYTPQSIPKSFALAIIAVSYTHLTLPTKLEV